MANKRLYEVQELKPFKGWTCVSKARSDLGVALDEFRAYARTASANARLRVLNTETGRVLRQHKPSKQNDGGPSSVSEKPDAVISPTKRKRRPRAVSAATS